MARYTDPYDTTQPTGYAPRQQPIQAPRPQPNPYGAPRQPQYPTLPQTPYGQPGYQTPRFPGFKPTNQFAADPLTSNLEQLINFQVPYYMQPVQQRDYLGQTSGEYGNLMNAINQVQGLAFGGPSPGEGALMSAFGALMGGGGNADAYANEYRKYLNTDPFTGAEWEAYQTEFMDPLQGQEDQAIAVAMRDLSDRGIDPSSGIAQAKLNEVRRGFQQAKAGAQNQLAINANQRREQRQGLRFQAGLSAEELKQRGYSAAASAAGSAANAWNNRLGLGLNAAGMGTDAAMQRAAMGYSQDRATRNEQYDNFNQALQLAQFLPALAGQRQQEALQLINGADPQSTVGMYGGLAGQRQNQAQFDRATYDALGSGLGTIASYYNRSGGGGGPVYNDPGFTTNTLPFPVGQTPYVPETYPGSAPWTYGQYYPGG